MDLRDFNLPIYDEPNIPSRRKYTKEYTEVWSEKIASYDVYIFVTLEYNHGIPAVLKNAEENLTQGIINPVLSTLRAQRTRTKIP